MRCRYCSVGKYFTWLRCHPSSELMGDSNDENPYLVVPGTDEYDVLSFLVQNPGAQFTPPEIAADTELSEVAAADALTTLSEDDLVQQSQDAYYIPVDRGDEFRRRLESVDAAAQLHDGAPDDDAYAVEDWEAQGDSL